MAILTGCHFGIGDAVMAWKLDTQRKGLLPLVADSCGLICHTQGGLYRVSYDLKQPEFICRLPVSRPVGHLANKLRLVDRILRLDPNHATVVDGALYLSRQSEIWRCDLTTGKISLDFVIPDGRRALEFGCIQQADGKTELVFGEYFSNPTRRPVRIWGKSSRSARWDVRGEFAAGEIEHVHAVTAIGERVYVLCGDFEHAASMWISDLNFSSLTPLLRGSQDYRAAWIAELGGRVFYATDTQLAPNHVYELFVENGVGQTQKLASVGGSSIYSVPGQGCRFFSTTVECGMPSGNFLYDIFETKRGPGILSSKAKIMSIDAHGICEDIFEAEKDALPFRLAQFGTFTFPTGEMPVNTVVAYGAALRGVDGTCLVFKK